MTSTAADNSGELVPLWDCVVVGCGGVGSFALRALRKKFSEAKILGIEQFELGHEQGSSHGMTRIYRKAYFEHPSYVPWIKYSEKIFHELSDDVIVQCGTLIVEEAGAATAVIEACQRSAREHGIPVQHLSNKDLRKRYPQFCLYSDKTVGLLEPGGGFVRPERAMETARNESHSEIWDRTCVEHVHEMEDHVKLLVNRNGQKFSLRAKKVIVSSGAWASKLLPLWRPYLSVTRQLQGWVDTSKMPDPSLFNPPMLPTWYMCRPDYPLPLYGIPADPSRTDESRHWTKVACHLRPTTVDPDNVSSSLTPEEARDLLQCAELGLSAFTKKDFAAAKPCLYTVTPDQHFIIGRHSSRVVGAAGLSGHGFKMTPALGAMLADLSLAESEAEVVAAWNMDFCSPKRFICGL